MLLMRIHNLVQFGDYDFQKTTYAIKVPVTDPSLDEISARPLSMLIMSSISELGSILQNSFANANGTDDKRLFLF